MAKLNMIQAINLALQQEMDKDGDVLVLETDNLDYIHDLMHRLDVMERIEAMLPEDRLWVAMRYVSETRRGLRITAHGPRPAALPTVMVSAPASRSRPTPPLRRQVVRLVRVVRVASRLPLRTQSGAQFEGQLPVCRCHLPTHPVR